MQVYLHVHVYIMSLAYHHVSPCVNNVLKLLCEHAYVNCLFRSIVPWMSIYNLSWGIRLEIVIEYFWEKLQKLTRGRGCLETPQKTPKNPEKLLKTAENPQKPPIKATPHTNITYSTFLRYCLNDMFHAIVSSNSFASFCVIFP